MANTLQEGTRGEFQAQAPLWAGLVKPGALTERVLALLRRAEVPAWLTSQIWAVSDFAKTLAPIISKQVCVAGSQYSRGDEWLLYSWRRPQPPKGWF